jgi:hypothetical protein
MCLPSKSSSGVVAAPEGNAFKVDAGVAVEGVLMRRTSLRLDLVKHFKLQPDHAVNQSAVFRPEILADQLVLTAFSKPAVDRREVL